MTKTHRPTQLQKATEFCNTLPPKADVHPRSCYVAFVPKPAVSRCSNGADSLLDHLVGAQHETSRNLMTNRLRGLEVDDQLKAGGLLDRHVGRIGAAEDAHHHS